MPPYVGLNGKTRWRLHTCISVQTLIFRQVVNFIRSRTLRSFYLALPHLTVARRVLYVTKVTNLETVKIEFRHLRFLLSSSFFFSAPSAFTRAVARPKHPRTVVKFSWQVPFELCF